MCGMQRCALALFLFIGVCNLHILVCSLLTSFLLDYLQVQMSDSGTCIAARLDYTSRYPEPSNQDPVYHYNAIGVKNRARYSWNCLLCSGNDVVFQTDNVCRNCSAAISLYKDDSSHLGAKLYTEAWLQYWNEYMVSGWVWRCELCLNISGTTGGSSTTGGSTTGGGSDGTISESCKCLQAQNDYLVRYPSVRTANLNPILHYGTSGFQSGLTWNCHYCDSNPIYFDDYCNCTTAQNIFMQLYPNAAPSAAEAYGVFLNSTNVYYSWKCYLCDGLPITHVDQSCRCIAARTDYLARYPQVQNSLYVDPVYYHEYIGGALGNTWNCALCNSNPFSYESPVCDCTEANLRYNMDYPGVTRKCHYFTFTFYYS